MADQLEIALGRIVLQGMLCAEKIIERQATEGIATTAAEYTTTFPMPDGKWWRLKLEPFLAIPDQDN